MKKVFIALFTKLVLVLIITGCSDDGNPAGVSGGNHVTGQVMIYLCTLWEDDFNNWGWDHRYTVTTGEKAEVRFICPDGHSRQVVTDDSSAFLLSIDSGAYDIIVITPHSYPDTFYNIEIAGDMSLNLKVLFDYLDDDYLGFTFRYSPPEDSLGEYLEKYYIEKLNVLTGYELRPDLAIRIPTANVIPYGYYYIRYEIPTTRIKYLWETYEKIRRYLNKEGDEFPEMFSMDYLGYLCFN